MDSIEDHLRKKKMPFRDHIYAKVAIDNTSAVGNPKGSGLSTLRHHIIEVAKKQSYWGEKRPIKWLLLADKLDREKAKKTASDSDASGNTWQGMRHKEQGRNFDISDLSPQPWRLDLPE